VDKQVVKGIKVQEANDKRAAAGAKEAVKTSTKLSDIP
jgi:hypothetical protein